MSEKMKQVISVLKETYPDTEISLEFDNTYELLVATMLSAQSTDKMVNEVTPPLFEKYPSVKDLAAAQPDDVVPLIRSLGLYNTKSKSLVGMATKVMTEYDGKIPHTMKGLTSLPGVGRKTANVIMGNAFGIKDSGITVDTHVKRIAKRLGFTEQTTAKKVEQDLMKIVPQEEWVDITHLLISHGREVCKARKPRCNICPLSDICEEAFEFDHFNNT